MARIKVQLLSSGQTGTIEEQEFDPKIYKSLQPTQQQGGGGLARTLLPIGGSILGGLLGTPFGLPGIIAGGAAGGAGGAALAGGSGGDIAKEAIFGGIGGPLGKGITGGAKLGAKALGAIGSKVTSKAAQSVLNTSPSVFTKAAETGLDINQVYGKYSKALGVRFDEMLGPVGKSGGNVGGLLNTAEQQIQNTLKAATGIQRLPGDVATNALTQELNIIKNSVDENRYNALKKIIDVKIKQDANGVPLSRALATKRAADSKFGRSILEEGTGSVAASADKIIANAYRKALKGLYPDMAEALETQHELLTLKPILEFARARTKSGSLGVSGLDLAKPGTFVQAALGNPQIGARLAGAGGIPIPKIPGAGAIGSQVLGQAGVRAFGGGQPQQEGEGFGGQDLDDITLASQEEEARPIDQDLTLLGRPVTRAQLVAFMFQNPKQAKLIQQMYEFENPQLAGGKVDANTQKEMIKIGNAENIVDQIEEDFSSVGITGRGIGQAKGLFSELTGASPKIRAYEAERQASIGPLARAISSEVGVLTDQDIKRAERLLPKLNDTQEEAILKINNLRRLIVRRKKLLQSLPSAKSESGIPLPEDTSSLGL